MKYFILIGSMFFYTTSLVFAQSPTATATVNVNNTIMLNSKLLLGTTFDARSGMNGNSGYVGNFTPAGTVVSDISTFFDNFPITTVRYPGQGIMIGFNWKKSIGLPASSRVQQNILGPLGPSQAVLFGFDEFIKWVNEKGVTGKDIQIMVPIYDLSTAGLKPIQMNQAKDSIADYCADWVEYANAPNDSTNPRGGKDWAAIRALNGHPEPYGIKIWNIGNEPWSSNEYNSTANGCTDYLTIITPIIDSMLKVDSTIKITLASVGSATSNWNNILINSPLVATGKIYGISPHAFPDETNPAKRVSSFLSIYSALGNAASNKGLKVFLGDYAHDIPNSNSQSIMDISVQWQGVTLCADFLLGISQIPNFERVNFWIYGMPVSAYHPIRLLNNVYTIMPVAEFYNSMHSIVLNKSVQVTNTSNPGSDGNSYAVNTSAFSSQNLDSVNVVSVNRDLSNTHILKVSGLSGYQLINATINSALAPSSENYSQTSITPNNNGDFVLPPSTVLVLKYTNTQTGFNEINKSHFTIECFPNPSTNSITIRANGEINNAEIIIYNSLGQEIRQMQNVTGKEFNISTTELKRDTYFVSIKNNSSITKGKFIVD